jgi:lipopolysaccharide biosynthesis glycosyltransferase
LLAATQARRHTSPDVAAVSVFFMHDGTGAEQYRRYFAEASVEFVAVDRSRIDAMSMYSARLFLDDFLDGGYSEILYMDADVQVVASLDELAGVELPKGKFLAARDPFVVCRDWDAARLKDIRSYYAGIGIEGEKLENYFNSGVLRASRQTWREISLAARDLIARQVEPFRFVDQDALNLVAQDRCLPMSFKWNFPAFFRSFLPPDALETRIEHFMSNPRPWFGPFRPWGWRAYEPYVGLVKQYPELAGMMKLSILGYAKYALQQEYKRWSERRTWGRPATLKRIVEIEGQAVL